MMYRAIPGKRGCGTRSGGGVYVECALGPNGTPLNEFLFDPPRGEGDAPSEWLRPHRSPITQDGPDGTTHLVLWIGEEHYPTVWDFIEETRALGASRRIPESLDFSKLTARSMMMLVHPTALSTATKEYYELDAHCPKRGLHPKFHPEHGSPECLGGGLYASVGHYDLPGPGWGLRKDAPTGDDTADAKLWRLLPCGSSYRVYPMPPPLEGNFSRAPALFMALPISGIAMVNQRDGKFDPDVEKRVSEAQVPTFRSDS